MATIFSRIIKGEIPCYKIAEDERYFAFLDINPLKEGHTLVVPKQETDYIFDLDDDQLAGLIIFSKKIAAAIKKAFPCNRIGIAVLGLEVPHAHIHLVPMDSMEDVNFRNPKLKLSPGQFQEIAEKIRAKI
ncbi:MAG TPA: HIT family protein [Bacteroidales bacterium]|jgi:histidine triad (HIT) family protein|nr:MAG: HIT-like protein [Bacteroidetes bacterium ADurb.Bin145]HQG62952.1 HIT family protein [Bacteroidales bacterium]